MNLIGSLLPKFAAAGLVLAAMLAVACGSDPTPTPTPVPTVVPGPTSTPLPPATPTPEPTTIPTPEIALSRDTLLPAGATFVVDANPTAMLESPVMMTFLGMLFDSVGSIGSGGTGSDFLDELESKTGIDLRSVEFVEMFADLETVLEAGLSADVEEDIDSPIMGAVLRGELNEADFAERLRAAAEEDPEIKYEVESYRGLDLYVGSNGNEGSFSFSFLDSGTLLFGTTDGVKAMIDVAEGDAPPLSGEGMQALDALGDRHLGVIMSTPPELLEMADEGTEDGMGMLGILDPTALSSPLTVMSFRVGDAAFEMQVRQFFEEETAAIASKEYTEGTMAMLGAMAGSPGIQDLFAGMTIGQSGLEVSYGLTISEAQIEEIVNFLFAFVAMSST